MQVVVVVVLLVEEHLLVTAVLVEVVLAENNQHQDFLELMQPEVVEEDLERLQLGMVVQEL
jgi:hypothetical protein